jgi:hypothetical protein
MEFSLENLIVITFFSESSACVDTCKLESCEIQRR